MPRPFGVWSPAQSIAEFKARCPRLGDFAISLIMNSRKEVHYHPEAMAFFKDPQQYKDAVDTCRAMRRSHYFFGHGVKLPTHPLIKAVGCLAVSGGMIWGGVHYYYAVWVPANSPTWRRFMNKEWEEAINNSPWDHMSHCWLYSDQTGAVMGNATTAGRKKFYVPA